MMKRYVASVFAAALFVSASTSSAPVAQERERWQGLMLNATGIGPTAGNFQIEITNWSTDEEIQEYIRILGEEGPRQLEGELNGNRNGFIRMNSEGTPLGLTRELPGPDGGRIIRMVSPREIGLERNGRLSRSGDYAFGIVELQLDSDGNGTGMVLPATELFFDAQGQLVIRSAGVPQVELTEVTKR